MNNVFINRGASARQINQLAEWARSKASVDNINFDIIRYIEIDIPLIFPGFHVYIETDDVMGRRRAYITNNPLGMVVSESLYEGAANNCLFSKEVILHEIGHLLLHYKYAALGLNNSSGIYVDQIKTTNPANSAEWQAATFAISFLFPYSRYYGLRDVAQIEGMIGLSPRYSKRIVNHISKIRVRERSASSACDRRWLSSVLRSLSVNEASKTRTRLQMQLDRFFSKRYQEKPEQNSGSL